LDGRGESRPDYLEGCAGGACRIRAVMKFDGIQFGEKAILRRNSPYRNPVIPVR
jgi:hypothetical protein